MLFAYAIRWRDSEAEMPYRKMNQEVKDTLSIIIPAYNEEARIITSLVKIHEYISGFFKDYEIIVVNDGSTDPYDF